mmetsp:Transcript_10655/g.33049  ORF Transcript_10655/g.33049 Transcript_10655/m.33049 type:complete len:203 (-) Transcript_10655:1208-1816(-)
MESRISPDMCWKTSSASRRSVCASVASAGGAVSTGGSDAGGGSVMDVFRVDVTVNRDAATSVALLLAMATPCAVLPVAVREKRVPLLSPPPESLTCDCCRLNWVWDAGGGGGVPPPGSRCCAGPDGMSVKELGPSGSLADCGTDGGSVGDDATTSPMATRSSGDATDESGSTSGDAAINCCGVSARWAFALCRLAATAASTL